MSASRWSMPGGGSRRVASPAGWWRSPRRRRNSSSVWRPVSSTATIGWRARSGAVSRSNRAAPAWTVMTLRLRAMTSRRSVAIRARSAATAARVCRLRNGPPSTWQAYRVDGDSDGDIDPYDPADAISSAAHYLNALVKNARGDLAAAVYGYNHSRAYVTDVL